MLISEARRRGASWPFSDLQKRRDYLRPVLCCLEGCTNVLIDGPSFVNPPLWTIHPLRCQIVIVRNITVKNPWHTSNSDGVNPDSCRNVLIEHCVFSTGDDCIAINSGRIPSQETRAPCENIVIRHCRMERGHGGIVIGSGMSGGVRNVPAHDCTFEGTGLIRLRHRRLSSSRPPRHANRDVSKLGPPPSLPAGASPGPRPECTLRQPSLIRLGGLERGRLYTPDQIGTMLRENGIQYSDGSGNGKCESVLIARKFGLHAIRVRVGFWYLTLCEGPAGELGKGRGLNTKNQV